MTIKPITHVVIEDYGCIQQASFSLSALHALIGPNDGGKSTALRAIRTAAQFAAGTFAVDSGDHRLPFDPMIDTNGNGPLIKLGFGDGVTYTVRNEHGIRERIQGPRGEVVTDDSPRSWNLRGLANNSASVPFVNTLNERLTEAVMIRFDPNALRRPSAQILAKDPIRFFDETGKGLASVYQAINSRDVDGFVSIRDEVRQIFPTVQSILVPTVEGNAVVLQARLTNGTVVQAPALSEGLLYFLGYAALQYLGGTRLLLVEEPENGLHPARIHEVMSILRQISQNCQVIIATHSPLVVNELQGHEVSVVTRDAETGTKAILLKDVPHFEESSKVYQPGELWLSYADGKSEAPLLTGSPRQ